MIRKIKQNSLCKAFYFVINRFDREKKGIDEQAKEKDFFFAKTHFDIQTILFPKRNWVKDDLRRKIVVP